jgi:hypothetical protein
MRLLVSSHEMIYQLARLLCVVQERYFWIHNPEWERAVFLFFMIFSRFSYFSILFANIYTKAMSENQERPATASDVKVEEKENQTQGK